MAPILEKEYNLRTADFDLYARLRPRTILDIFQDIAGDHAILLGCGIQDIPSRGMAWVLTKTRYEIYKQPDMYSRVKAVTWPLSPGKFTYRREYKIESLEGETIVLGTSEWVIMDFEDRKLKMVPDIYKGDDCLTELALNEEKLRKIPSATDPYLTGTELAQYSDQDTNLHVNNIVYADYVMNLIRPTKDQEIKRFEIDYHKEVKAGDRMLLSAMREDSGRLLVDAVSDYSEKREKLFCASVAFK